MDTKGIIMTGSDPNIGRPVMLAYDEHHWSGVIGTLALPPKHVVSYREGANDYAEAYLPEVPDKEYMIVFFDSDGNFDCAVPVGYEDVLFMDVGLGTKERPHRCGSVLRGSNNGTHYHLLPEEGGTVHVVYDFYDYADTLELYYYLDESEDVLIKSVTASNEGSFFFSYDPTVSRKLFTRLIRGDREYTTDSFGNKVYYTPNWEFVLNCPT